MTIGSFKRISARKLLCTAVAAAVGLVAVSTSTHFLAQVQTSQQAAAPDQIATVHVDVTPEHVLNTIYRDTATGAWMDDLTKAHPMQRRAFSF